MDSLGDRMKNCYEGRSQTHLLRRLPVIIRLDGRAFHTLTRTCERPFDDKLHTIITCCAEELMKNASGSRCAYVQSDEISMLLVDYDKPTTEAWFDYNVQKIVSISAGIVSSRFTTLYESMGVFDSRVFGLPVDEVCNYFIWRQKDQVRNSIHMLARHYYSHKDLLGKHVPEMHEMLHSIGVNWCDLSDMRKNGSVVYRDTNNKIVVSSAPIFTESREFINNMLVARSGTR
jgi:tRNA(His) guanylyltransferase